MFDNFEKASDINVRGIFDTTMNMFNYGVELEAALAPYMLAVVKEDHDSESIIWPKLLDAVKKHNEAITQFINTYRKTMVNIEISKAMKQ